MSGLQIFITLFGLIALSITIWAVWAVVKSPHLRWKSLWIVGSLIANVGFTINWSSPGDLFVWFGLQIPFFHFYTLTGSGQWIAKVGIPIVAIVALAKANLPRAITESGN